MKSEVDVFAGVLLGTAVGDALGLPAEGLSPARIRKRWHGVWRHRLLPGRGMVSDDTEHTVMVAQALLSAPADVATFQRDLARRLRWWFARLPAGVGLATARACLRLWLGVPPHRAGVYSAGNGPAMRSAIVGAFFRNDPARRRDYVRASTRLTHADPRAEVAAQAVAEATAGAARRESSNATILPALRELSGDAEWPSLVQRVEDGLSAGQTVEGFATALGQGQGVSGYAYRTVPVAIFAWLRHGPDFERALTAALNCGGDTDTVGAIVGGICGAATGEAAIPSVWRSGLWDWPCSTNYLRALARCLTAADGGESCPQPPKLSPSGSALRNLFFLTVVLAHGVGRLLKR